MASGQLRLYSDDGHWGILWHYGAGGIVRNALFGQIRKKLGLPSDKRPGWTHPGGRPARRALGGGHSAGASDVETMAGTNSGNPNQHRGPLLFYKKGRIGGPLWGNRKGENHPVEQCFLSGIPTQRHLLLDRGGYAS